MVTEFIIKWIGSGISGKRQGGWIVFVITTAILLIMVITHAFGSDMTAFVPLMVIAWPTAMGAALGPHILHYLKPGAYPK